VFDPTVTLDIRVNNIRVEGSFEIGSEACPYFGQLTITITGRSFGFVSLEFLPLNYVTSAPGTRLWLYLTIMYTHGLFTI